ncbi:hypothetical protein ACO0QE_002721 [Hanseniaspora vineae]
MSQPPNRLPENVSDEVLRQIGEKSQNYIQEAQKIGISTDQGKDFLKKGQRLKEVYMMYVKKRQAKAEQEQANKNLANEDGSTQAQMNAQKMGTTTSDQQQNSNLPTNEQPGEVSLSGREQDGQKNEDPSKESTLPNKSQQNPEVPPPQQGQQDSNTQSQESHPQETTRNDGSHTSPPPPQGSAPPNSITIRQLLDEEQTKKYNELQAKNSDHAKRIVEQHTQCRRQIEALDKEVKKDPSDPKVPELQASREQLVGKLRNIAIAFKRLEQMISEEKRRFYLECAQVNQPLRRFLQARQLQAQAAQHQQQQQQQQQQMQQQQVSQQVPQPSAPPPPPQQQQQGPQQPAAQQQQQQQQQQQTPQQSTTQAATLPAPVSVPPAGPNGSTPAPGPENAKTTTQNAASNTNTNSTLGIRATPVNAAAAANEQNIKPQAIFKQSPPNIPLSDHVQAKELEPVPYNSGRPTVTGGAANGMASVNTPAMVKIPPYEVEGDRVMSKRKLRELVKTVGVDEGDGSTTVDGDVEELLLDLADDFITNVVSFACRLAKHRKSENLEAKDLQLHLERNWNIRVPGFSADEIRPTSKWNPAPQYVAKMAGIKQQAKLEQEQREQEMEQNAAAAAGKDDQSAEPATKKAKTARN